MMQEDSQASEDVKKRPQTPHDFSLLKTLRYEDAADGIPPVPVASINPPKSGPPSRPAPAEVGEQVSSSRPRTAPSSRERTPTKLAYDAKRDSGIAPSLSTTGRTSYAESSLSSPALGAAKEPSLPTIVVQDDEVSPPATERSRLPFGKRKSTDKPRSRSAPRGIERIRSFKGIQSEIPSGGLGDFDLEDLASDKVGFSKRGSLLFGGKKMNKLVESQASEAPRSNGVISPNESRSNPTTTNEDNQVEQEAVPDAPKQGLVSGSRKPSVHMLQASIQGGRVLSAEEITFSMKVRSMYEHGDERGADWTTNSFCDGSTDEPSESGKTDISTPDASIDSIAISKTRQEDNDGKQIQRSQTPDVRVSYYREPHELAGGIEDWEDVDGRTVDRYGFINPRRPGSGTSAGSQQPTPGIQRVATSLRVEADQPRGSRKLRRGASVASRNSRSVPAQPNREGTIVGSTRSFKSHRSIGPLHSGNPFRSRDRKTLNEASDMLTLPPGLADIAEEQDAGRTASAAKRKEWEREIKWQKMARPMREKRESGKSDKSLGGGMQFDFDTNDQKLVSRTWKGIPDRWRATAWHSFLSVSARRRGIGASDDELTAQYHTLQETSSADDVQIDVDVPRTIRLHIMFRRRYRGGQRLLFRVLHAISLYFPDTGYVQGMASLAATLLCYYDEERAFVMMVRLWQLRGLEQLFQAGFGGLMKALEEFERDWLRNGDVAKKLEELCITSTAYGTRWYLTLFNMSIPFPAQLRVWDAFMLLGDAATATGNEFGGADLDVLHATSAALVDATREIILDSDFENTMKVLTSFIPIKDEDLLMRVTRAEWKMRKKRGAAKT